MRTLPESCDIQEPEVEYWPTEYDWIGFRITSATKRLRIASGPFYDPLPDLRRWLEAAAIGVNRCSFWFDDEGTEFEFELEHYDRSKSLFRVSHYYREPDEAPLICAFVDRRTLVEAFYRPFFALDGDPQIKANWEVRHLSDEVCTELGMTFDETVEYAIGLSSTQLCYLLYKTDSFDTEERPYDYELVGELVEPRNPIIPKDYDSWPPETRRPFIVERLNAKFENYGTNIRDFRSPIVEAFLGNQVPLVSDVEIG
ncbi:MAG: hypothetical protein IPN69_02225 [Acidobacteria bacterium]|nr:hypothetical protein [Acidobacteriota bacterium]